jgi:hypothetical protein
MLAFSQGRRTTLGFEFSLPWDKEEAKLTLLLTTMKKEGSPHMDEQTQQRLETLFAAAIGFGLSRLVAERFIKDLVPEQRGIKDDVLRGLLRAGTTAASTVLASVLVRRVAKAVGGT